MLFADSMDWLVVISYAYLTFAKDIRIF